MLKSGISRIGGKFRLRKELLEETPYHEFFLSMFAGACWYELNKPRVRYECFNDKDSELINYFIQIRKHPKKFDEMKRGVFGLVSQEICNQIVNGKLQPRNDLERAYFFYYLNKLTFSGCVKKGNKGIIDQQNLPGRVDKPGINEAKDNYKEYKTKGFAGIVNTRAVPQNTLHQEDFEKIKANYSGLINKAALTKSGYGRIDKKEFESLKSKSTSYKGINPKTTRPFTNNDCGLLSPLDLDAIKRLRYVNLTAYDFRRVYELFFKAFHVRKGLGPECLIYADPPYPGTESYYTSKFGYQEHSDLLWIMFETPFHFMLSIGGEEVDFYLDAINRWEGAQLNSKNKFYLHQVSTKYSTDANSQKDSQEYIITNYDINNEPKLSYDNQITLESFMEA